MKVCLAGYGLIGREWVRHYRADAFEVAVWNRSPRPEAPGFNPDLGHALAGADVLHLVVADPAAVESVLTLAGDRIGPGLLVIQSSTISPSAAGTFEAFCLQRGAAYAEAPFTGSKPAAEARQNVFYLGGAKEAKDQAARVLHGLSRKIVDIGTVAQASALKLAMNLQIASISQALAEGLSLARRSGISDACFFDVLECNIARSGLSDLKKDKLIRRDYDPQFSVKHMAKDLRLALETGSPSEFPLTSTLAGIYRQGLDAGWGEDDFSALIRLLEAEAVGGKKREQGP
ncbi:MAG: NAD(P)-dependent oxidoreductase [Candidatus Methylacidiphilales bacterium]|nr:NAD(P)-dependent oxidoreductase [Candidatus Methylacidiphilales bacterium]